MANHRRTSLVISAFLVLDGSFFSCPWHSRRSQRLTWAHLPRLQSDAKLSATSHALGCGGDTVCPAHPGPGRLGPAGQWRPSPRTRAQVWLQPCQPKGLGLTPVTSQPQFFPPLSEANTLCRVGLLRDLDPVSPSDTGERALRN